MKTYSRKNSRYLKKAFIASNFNEMCRLCLSELDLGLTPIFQEFSKISYRDWIQYSVDVLIEEGDGLPPNVCEECLTLVEQTYLFKKKCQASDSKLREHLELLEVDKEGKFNDIGLIDLPEDHRNLLEREEEARESKCDESSAVDSGGTDTQQPDKHHLEEVDQTKQQNQPVEEEQPTKPMEEKQIEQSLPAEELVEDPPPRVVYSDSEFGYNEPQGKVVKRYILKGGKISDDQEEDLTLCEVVPLNVKNDEMSEGEETLTYITLKCPSQNGHESEYGNTQETKIKEIYQLWDNEEEVEEVVVVEEKEVEKEQEGVMILDVSWENNAVKSKETENTEEVVVDVEKNGVVELQTVQTNKNQPVKTETKTVTKTDPVSFKCFACGKDFSKGVELKSHLSKYHHEVSDAAFCNICGKSFVCSNNLKRHMAIHTGYKPHKCKICGRTFTQGSILKRHVFTHATLKPFNCQICGKGYTQKMNLLAHFKTHGFKTEGETYNCQYCNKTFVHQSGLSRHAKTHKGVRFACEHCDRTFGDSSALTRHIRTVHSK